MCTDNTFKLVRRFIEDSTVKTQLETFNDSVTTDLCTYGKMRMVVTMIYVLCICERLRHNLASV